MSSLFFSQPEYAECYRDVVLLPRSGVYFESRAVGERARELASLYPRLIQSRRGLLGDIVDELAALDGFVAMVAATDPVTITTDCLASVATRLDHLSRFKTHYLIDRRLHLAYSPHHQRDVDRAKKSGDFREEVMSAVLNEWLVLYDNLAKRHMIVDPFPAEWFVKLSQLPGLKFYSHRKGGKLIGASIWALEGARAYYMFSAADADGYRVGSHYGLVDCAVAMNPLVDVFDLGSNPGADDTHHGLSRFKSGFSNRRADSYLIGKILDHESYQQLSSGKRTRYFPAYRTA